MPDSKYASVHYRDYLDLDKILDAQHPRSAALGKEAHDEMLFIIVHQVYELWFKQILHELLSIRDLFEEGMNVRKAGIAVHLLRRITEIQHILIAQLKILETMTPLDFLEFRSLLLPASGFQSVQFRKLEVVLGLKMKARTTYAGKDYREVFDQSSREYLTDLENRPSIGELLQEWFENIPFLKWNDFDFTGAYRKAVQAMISREKEAVSQTAFLSEEEKKLRHRMLGDEDGYFSTVMDESEHNKLLKEGKVRLSFKATQAALFIALYRDEPILQIPFQLINALIDVDEQFTTWRYRHAQMVLRMLGKKIGTGGSSGYDYLRETAERHRLFPDLYNLSTLMIPRADLPVLPEALKRQLGYFYGSNE